MPKYINVDKLKFPNVAVYDMMLDGRAVPVVRLDELHKLSLEDVNEALCETIEMLKKQVFDMSSLIGDYSEKTRWVSVTERLPENDCHVLAYYGFNRGDGYLGMMFMQVLDYYARDPRPHFQHEGLNGMTVTHWMPLPEPPKEKV